MGIYALNQTLDDVRWGTPMPVAVQIKGQIVQIRARGTCSLAVTDTVPLAAQIPDLEDVAATLRPVFAVALTDLIGELSINASNLAQLTTITDQTRQLLLAKLEPALAAFGLQIKSLHIEAIESV